MVIHSDDHFYFKFRSNPTCIIYLMGYYKYPIVKIPKKIGSWIYLSAKYAMKFPIYDRSP